MAVDEKNRPLGWLSAARLSTVSDEAEVTGDLLASGGSLYHVNPDDDTTSGSLRAALDSALSSPSSHGIAVDENGAVVGCVRAEDVLAALSAARDSGKVPS